MRIPEKLISALREAKRVAVLTGAGVSAESGVPTFRNAQTGLWADFKPEELATPRAFKKNPKLVWEWYDWRRKKVREVEPNPAHRALAALAERFAEFALITQNVDGLHQRAGSRDVIELHGNIERVKCFDEDVVVTEWKETGDVPPKCPRCGGLLRPGVVWFEEAMPVEAMARAFAASRSCDVFLTIGTSAVVYPAAQLPVEATESGATVVEINPDSTPLSERMDVVLKGPAGVILPELVRAVWG